MFYMTVCDTIAMRKLLNKFRSCFANDIGSYEEYENTFFSIPPAVRLAKSVTKSMRIRKSFCELLRERERERELFPMPQPANKV